MTSIKQLFTSSVFCLYAFISAAQPGNYFIGNLQPKVGYIHTQEGAAEFQLLISKEVDIIKIAEVMTTSNCKVISVNEYFHRITIKMDVDWIYNVIYPSYVLWIEEILPLELNGSSTPAAHNGRLVHEFGYRGAGVTIGVWEGSAAIEHVDMLGRYLNFTNLGNTNAINHTMAVLGIMAGNGNMNMNLPGMATQAEVVIRDFQGDIAQEMKDAIDSNGIVVTQNSYSISPTADPCAIRGSYKIVSKDIDKLVWDNPYLVHVFSAGNGQSDCSANGTTGFRTIPSGYQSAKNVITVGAVNAKDSVTDQSAWGPVLDGRIKPEVVALGEGVTSLGDNNNYVNDLKGTSYAAPVVSGLAAQLSSRYKTMNGVYPPASLVRAVICNSADDLGNPGPDYKYGFGKVNAYRAMDCINTSKYRVDSVNHQGQRSFSVIVPANAKQLKVTIAWSDPEGNPANPKALVNDVDMGLLDPAFNGYLPWVLDSTANNKKLPAVRGNDRINNIEQITIDNPISGSYSVLVLGEYISAGYQTFSIAYEIVKPGLNITYPIGGESFEPGENITVWWNSTEAGNYKLEYSLNDGANWSVIKDGIDSKQTGYEWEVPVAITRDAKFRLTQGASIDSTGVFNIMASPSSYLGFGCDGIAKLYWKKIQGASVYDLYRITNGEAEYFASTVDSSFTISGLINSKEYWYAVKARTSGGVNSKRAQFIKVIPGVDPDYNEISLVMNQDSFCMGDTLRLSYTNSFGASGVEFEWRSKIGDWALLAKNGDSTKKAIWADIYIRAKYTNVCGKVKYTDEVRVKADTANAKYTPEHISWLEFRFIPVYQDTNAIYLWKFGDGGFDTQMIPIYKYSFPSIFTTTLEITSPIGCSDKDTVIIRLIGVPEQELTNLKVYPNPANTYIDVELEGGFNGDVAISMYTILGKQVDNIEIVKLNNEICRINTATLPEGVYVVKLLINSKIYTNKLIIER